ATPATDAWSDGPNLWIIDLIAPFGNAMSIARDLQCSVFADWLEPVWALRRKPDGTVRALTRWPTLSMLDRVPPQKGH
ncbi:toxin-activating lysine-acyltransferase, partial [Elstera litoralis]|uniref:toxin-activating lysine-acyltransferase n=1 Tax=Elstera litoralis TaxID=552518 RepID=UPI0012ECD770